MNTGGVGDTVRRGGEVIKTDLSLGRGIGRVGDVQNSDGTVTKQDLRLSKQREIHRRIDPLTKLEERMPIGGETPQERGPMPVRQFTRVELQCPFQVYPVGFGSTSEMDVEVGFGTVMKDALDVTSEAAIDNFDDPITVQDGGAIWLKASFDPETGELNSLSLESGAPEDDWEEYPKPVADVDGSQIWYHLIAHVRAPREGKTSGRPDEGQTCFLDDACIQQDTHTHLVVTKKCIGLTRESYWVLEPHYGTHT